MTVVTTEQMIFMAEQHLLAGRFAEAEGLARHALTRAPSNGSALRTAGMAIFQAGRFEQSISFLYAAVQQAPEHDLTFHLATALSRTGRQEDAIKLYRSLIDAVPDRFDSWPALASSLHKQKRLIEAEQLLVEAIRKWPAAASLRFYLGLICADADRIDDAVASYRAAIDLDDSLAEAHANLGVVLKTKGLLTESIASYRRSIELAPGIADVHCNLGVALFDQGNVESAMACYRRAIEIDSTFANAYYNLGNALRLERRNEEAVQVYIDAVKARPDFVQAFSNLAMSLNELGQHQLALRAYDRAVAIQPAWAEPRWNRTLTHLLLGDFKRGWSEFDRRNELTPPSSRTFPGPRWEGQRLEGRTILLNYEMGLGDTIHFVRYVPLVAERVSRVVVECQPELRELFRSIAGADEVITLEKDGVSPKYDVHCSLMRLPQLFNSDERSMPRSVPYLSPPADRVQRWANRMSGSGKRKVGLVWAGSPLHQNDRERSIRLEMLSGLADERIEFFSLQRGPAAEQASTPPGEMRLTNWTNEFENMADTAALMANLDLVIGVDTSLIHLAGAIGKVVWVLIPLVPDWRWLLERPDTPWYPTMRLFRQTRLHDWTGPIEKIAAELRRLMSETEEPRRARRDEGRHEEEV